MNLRINYIANFKINIYSPFNIGLLALDGAGLGNDSVDIF
jgi:hypothetical protein